MGSRLDKSHAEGTIANTAEAVMETRKTVPGYIADHPEFHEIGERMIAQWEEGVKGLVER